MKYFIASDIHGSAYYCRLLLECYKNEKADRILLLGDILYHGPRNDLPKDYAPKEVIAMLNPLKNDILCVCGNCDTEVDQMVLDFPILADYAILSEGKHMIFATHGHNFNESKLPPLRWRRSSSRSYSCSKMCRTRKLCVYQSRLGFHTERGQSSWIYDTRERKVCMEGFVRSGDQRIHFIMYLCVR